jgi:ADP-heptose:LPS heptosyltransferase
MKICVLRLGAMGDILFTTPALRALRRQYPEAHITYILLDKWRFLLRGNPNVDRVVGLPYREPKALGRLRRECFDLVINFHEMEDGARLCQALRARERRGHQWKNSALCPDENSRLLIKDSATLLSLYRNHISYPDLFCRIAKVEPDSLRYDYFPSRLAEWKARFFFVLRGGRGKDCVALHLHSRGMSSKLWNPVQVREVVRALPNQHFILLTYPPDREKSRLLENEPNVWVCPHPISVQAEILRRCALFVGIDSGPRQIAAAMHTPALTLFGPRPPEHLPQFPGDRILRVERSCAPCYEEICPKGEDCLSYLSPERIADEIRGMLEEIRTKNSLEPHPPIMEDRTEKGKFPETCTLFGHTHFWHVKSDEQLSRSE